MLVTRILGDCPGCRRKMSFGNVNVFGGNNLIRGCGYCTYSEEIALPPIKKKVLYLDQFFFSHAFRGEETRFVEAAERIKHIAGHQLLAAPYSSLHDIETLLWSRRDELREFIREVSRGAKFVPFYQVEHTQIIRAFRAWLAGEPARYVLEERDAIHGNLHEWDGYFRIEVAQPSHDPNLVRDSKQRSVEGLVAIFEDWRRDSTTFQQDVEEENAAAARGFVDTYAKYVVRVATGDLTAFLDSPVMSKVVESMMQCLPDSDSVEDRLSRCGTFFRSEHFRSAPRQLLSARIYAALKAMVKQGAYVNAEKAKARLSGFYYDVDHIATYAPYCDAIIIDQPMAELVGHPKVALEQTFGVKVFSLQRWDDLFAWLEDLEAHANAEHRAALAAIYPITS